VTQRVVDDFEPVEIEEHHGKGMFHAPRVGQSNGQPVAEEAAVRQSGQRVVIGLILDLLLDPLPLRDVARDSDDLADLAG